MFLCCILFFVCPGLFGQKNTAEVNKVRKDAAQLFKDENFSAAFPLYSQLLSLNPKDPDLNFRFGVCFLYTDKRDVEKPLKYLEFAAKSKDIDYHDYFYLGKAYHYNYRFVEAVRMFERFKKFATSREMTDFQVERQIVMCQNGMQLLSKINDIYVLEKTEVKRVDFYRSYYKADINGVFLAEPENFKSKADKKNNDKNVVFFPDKQQILCFSSYGKEALTGRDIYFSSRKDDGSWDVPVKLDSTVNTPYDEDFPYLLNDGKTLFFSSTGHSSMGGYDIFRTVYDSVKKQWSKPVNLDFAINTPYDDILFVPDTTGKYAYFSSDRSSQPEKIMVFKVRIDLRPEQKIELDLQNGLAADYAPDQKYLQAISLIKDLASLEVNATSSMFTDDSNTESKDNLAANSLVSAGKDTTESVYALRAKKLVTQRNNNEKIVDSAFLLISKAENSLEDLKVIYLTPEELTITSLNTKDKKIVDVVQTDIEATITKKQKKLEQLKDLAGQVQKSVNTNDLAKSKKLLASMYTSVDATDTSTTAFEMMSKELRKAVEDSKSVSSKNKSNFFSISAVNKIKRIAQTDMVLISKQDNSVTEEKNPAKEIESEQDVKLSNTESRDSSSIAATNLNVGDSIPNSSAETTEVVQPVQEDNHTVEPNASNDPKIGRQIFAVLSDSLKVAEQESRNQVLLAEVVIRNLSSTLNRLKKAESKPVSGTENSEQNKVALPESLKVPKDSISFVINQLITAQLVKEYLNDYQTSSEMLYKTLTNNLLDDRIVKSAADSGVYIKAMMERIALYRSDTRDQMKPEAIATYITNARERLIEQKNTYLKLSESLSAEAITLESSSLKLSQEAEILTSAKAKKEYRKKSGDLLKEAFVKREDALTNYNKFVIFNNATSFVSNDIDQLQLLVNQFNLVPQSVLARTKPSKSEKDGTITLQKDVDEYLANKLNSKDQSFPAIIENENEASTSAKEINRLTGSYMEKEKLAVDSSSVKKIIASVSEFKEPYSFFYPDKQEVAKNEETEKKPANGSISPISGKMKAELKSNEEVIGKLNKFYNKLEKENAGTASREELLKKEEALDFLSDTISKIEGDLTKRWNEPEIQAEENKPAALKFEMQLFEIKAVGNKTRYASSLIKIQIASSERGNEINTLVNSLVQDAAYHMDKASALEKQLLEEKSEVKKKEIQQQKIKSPESALSFIEIAEKASVNKLNLLKEKGSTVVKDSGITIVQKQNHQQLETRLDNNQQLAETAENNQQIATKVDNNQQIAATADNNQQLATKVDNNQQLAATAENNQQLAAKVDNNQQLAATAENNQQLAAKVDNNQQLAETAENNQQIATKVDNNQQIAATADNKQQQATKVDNNQQLAATAENNQQIETKVDNNQQIAATADNNQQVVAKIDDKQQVVKKAENNQQITTKVDNKQQVVEKAENKQQQATKVDNNQQVAETADNNQQLVAKIDNNQKKVANAETAKEEEKLITDKRLDNQAEISKERAVNSDSSELAAGVIERENFSMTPVPSKEVKALLIKTERSIAEAVVNSAKPQIEFLYYTVQVGVYKAPRASFQLMNITPLFEEILNNGLYKYCSGIFMDYKNAVGHKNTVVAKGIPDAFVVAYYKGRKISIDEAFKMQGGKLAEIMDQKAVERIVNANTKAPEVHYCVQLVAYKKAIPDAAIKSFQEKLNQKVILFTTETGMNVLLSAAVSDFQGVTKKRAEIVAQGVADAFIVGFINGKRVSSAEARKALGQ